MFFFNLIIKHVFVNASHQFIFADVRVVCEQTSETSFRIDVGDGHVRAVAAVIVVGFLFQLGFPVEHLHVIFG